MQYFTNFLRANIKITLFLSKTFIDNEQQAQDVPSSSSNIIQQ